MGGRNLFAEGFPTGLDKLELETIIVMKLTKGFKRDWFEPPIRGLNFSE